VAEHVFQLAKLLAKVPRHGSEIGRWLDVFEEKVDAWIGSWH
jgi:hypothetical protein